MIFFFAIMHFYIEYAEIIFGNCYKKLFKIAKND